MLHFRLCRPITWRTASLCALVIGCAACQPEPTPLPVSAPVQVDTPTALAPTATIEGEAQPPQAYSLALRFQPAAPLDDPELLALVSNALDSSQISLFAPDAAPLFQPLADPAALHVRLANAGFPDGLRLPAFSMDATFPLSRLATLFSGGISLYPAASADAASVVFAGWFGEARPPLAEDASPWIDLFTLPSGRPGG